MPNLPLSLPRWLRLFAAGAFASAVWAQPSPDVQKRIDQAIQDAANKTSLDYTAFVNPFIGTGAVTYGDVW